MGKRDGQKRGNERELEIGTCATKLLQTIRCWQFVLCVGEVEGAEVVGAGVGAKDGAAVGVLEGCSVGDFVGAEVGFTEGIPVGLTEGIPVGLLDCDLVGT